MADATPGTTTGTSVDAPAIALSTEQQWETFAPEPGERVLLVPQSASHLTCPHYEDCLVGQPGAVLEQYASDRYGSPSWHTWSGRDGRHELPIGYALLVIRDGLVRRGSQNWDSGD